MTFTLGKLLGWSLGAAVAGSIITGAVVHCRKKVDKYADQRKGSKKSTKRK